VLDFDFVAPRKENAPEKGLGRESPVTKFEKITRFAQGVQMAALPPPSPASVRFLKYGATFKPAPPLSFAVVGEQKHRLQSASSLLTLSLSFLPCWESVLRRASGIILCDTFGIDSKVQRFQTKDWN